jgi:hypothetical protein
MMKQLLSIISRITAVTLTYWSELCVGLRNDHVRVPYSLVLQYKITQNPGTKHSGVFAFIKVRNGKDKLRKIE